MAVLRCRLVWACFVSLLQRVVPVDPAAPDSPLLWVLASPGVECALACSQKGRDCDEESWPETSTQWEAVARITPGLNCRGSAPGGWTHNPSICIENQFLSPRGGMCFWQGGPGPRCSGGLQDFQTPIARRVCPCRREEVDTTEVASAAMFALDAATIASRVNVLSPLKVPSAAGGTVVLSQGLQRPWPLPHAGSSVLYTCECNHGGLGHAWSEHRRLTCCREVYVSASGGARAAQGWRVVFYR
mmetsp:Transcript_64818/g.180425  ORF Transcript_64818/g.180425 Transcript_64818/m.180425 type:complete len:244 (+) Transcript_64818:46-777(+)